MQTERVKKKVLVAGAAGFIGSHLCDRLIKEEYEVLCLDNCYTGNTVNIEHLLHHSRFTFMEHDVIQPYHVSPSDQRSPDSGDKFPNVKIGSVITE